MSRTSQLISRGQARSQPAAARAPPYSICACLRRPATVYDSHHRTFSTRADATPFQGGSYRVRLVLPSDFPNAPPKGAAARPLAHPTRALRPRAHSRAPPARPRLRATALADLSAPAALPGVGAHTVTSAGAAVAGYFLTKIFHPNIAKSGEICVNTLKRDWKADLGIGHVLQARRCDLS